MSANFDFDSIQQRLITRLRSKASWSEILFYSTNLRLIDAVSEEIAYFAQYDEILTRETKWSLAKQLSSLMTEVQFFNYTPYRKIGSSGKIKVSTSKTFDATYPINISFPKYSIISNGNDIKFAISSTTALLSTDQSTYVSVIQGTPKSQTFIASGTEYETFTLTNDSVENSVYDIYVNGELWTQVDNIREATTSTSKNYFIKSLNDFSGIVIGFGNDNFGKKLTSGDSVVVRYIETLGSQGNVLSTNIITTVESIIYDVNGDPVTVYCTNDETLTGGSEVEDIESIRTKAPNAYNTGDRAINKADYKYIVETFSFAKKANVWGETEVNEDKGNLPGTYIATEENVVHICVVTTSGNQITTAQETEMRDVLTVKKAPVDIVVFEKVNYVYIIFNIQAFIADKRYSLSQVSENIRSTLATDYSISTMDFKKPIRNSDYVAKIDAVTGVDYHTTTFKLYTLSSFESAYSTTITTNINDITPSTFKVYVKLNGGSYVQIAHDNGLGTLVAETGYTVSTSTITYSSGQGALIVSGGLIGAYASYTIKYEFGVDTKNILPTKRNQIATFGDATITCTYE